MLAVIYACSLARHFLLESLSQSSTGVSPLEDERLVQQTLVKVSEGDDYVLYATERRNPTERRQATASPEPTSRQQSLGANSESPKRNPKTPAESANGEKQEASNTTMQDGIASDSQNEQKTPADENQPTTTKETGADSAVTDPRPAASAPVSHDDLPAVRPRAAAWSVQDEADTGPYQSPHPIVATNTAGLKQPPRTTTADTRRGAHSNRATATRTAGQTHARQTAHVASQAQSRRTRHTTGEAQSRRTTYAAGQTHQSLAAAAETTGRVDPRSAAATNTTDNNQSIAEEASTNEAPLHSVAWQNYWMRQP